MKKTETNPTARQTCAKCGQANEAGARHCGQCGSRLVLVCRKCGEANDRAAIRCQECGTRLHRSLIQRLKAKVRKRYQPAELAVIIVGFVLLVVLVSWLAGVSASPPMPGGGEGGN